MIRQAVFVSITTREFHVGIVEGAQEIVQETGRTFSFDVNTCYGEKSDPKALQPAAASDRRS